MDLILLILVLISIISASLAISVEDRMNSIVTMVISTTAIGLMFLHVGAYYAGIFHLLIYSGVIGVLFASSSYFLETQMTEEEEMELLEVFAGHE